MLRGMSCVHDFDNFRQGQLFAGVSEETVEAVRKAYPIARHPMVIRLLLSLLTLFSSSAAQSPLLLLLLLGLRR